MSVDEDQNTLKDLVLDEQKLVTYVSLSKEMCIHVNRSKLLLSSFVKDIRQKQPGIELNVTYIVSGLREDNKAVTTVCTEEDMANLTKSLSTVFFKHIYGVSKGVPRVDSVAFLALSRFEDFPLCTGLIKSNQCSKRSCDEIGNLKTISQEVPKTDTLKKTQSAPVSTKKKFFKEATDSNANKTKEILKEDSNMKLNVGSSNDKNADLIIKSEVVSPKKGLSEGSKPKIDTKIKAQKGIAGFFGKQNGAPAKKIKEESKVVPLKETVKNEVKVEKMEVDDEIPSTAEAITSGEKNKEMTRKKYQEKKLSSTKLQDNTSSNTKESNITNSKSSLKHTKKNAKVDKKRKRVLQVSDSEDEDPFVDEPVIEENISEDEIPATPTVATVKITSAMVNPKKRRKVVDKTYTDEDGYILTRKEEIFESCSENEEEKKENETIESNKQATVITKEISPKTNKKVAAKTSKKKISPPQKGKQATMMNFFKKV